jgi:hypothetical protein
VLKVCARLNEVREGPEHRVYRYVSLARRFNPRVSSRTMYAIWQQSPSHFTLADYMDAAKVTRGATLLGDALEALEVTRAVNLGMCTCCTQGSNCIRDAS